MHKMTTIRSKLWQIKVRHLLPLSHDNKSNRADQKKKLEMISHSFGHFHFPTKYSRWKLFALGWNTFTFHWCLAPLISRIYETRFTGSELAKICYTCNALADVIEGWFFHHFIRIEISWGSAEKIIKIRPTVAELSAKNHFFIVNANLIRG